MSAAAPPAFSVVMPVRDPALVDLERAVRSVERQHWPDTQLCLADDGSRDPAVRDALGAIARRPHAALARLERSGGVAAATNAALALARGEFAVFVDHDDELADGALFEIARLLEAHPDADLVYSDHDIVDGRGERLHVEHKPDWSPELLLSTMYVGHVMVARTALARELGGFRAGFEGASDHDFALRLAERSDRVHHLPSVLYHWRAAPGSMALRADAKPRAFAAGRAAVQQALDRRGAAARAEWPGWARRARLGAYRLRFTATRDLPVTILIPTRDRLDLLRPCIESIERHTAHRAWKLLILDNDSRDPELRAYLRATRHAVLPVPGPFFFSAIVNRGVEAAETEQVVLLNDDTRALSPHWLDALLGYGQLEGVGAVGPLLRYPDGRIQHAGWTLGVDGLAAPAFRGKSDRPYPLAARVARNCAAVSAACMWTRRSLFLEVGGFDATYLPVAWGDVDYCLRLRRRGWRTVVNPDARLVHLEAQSRDAALDPNEITTLRMRWPEEIAADPYYNRHLTRLDTGFEVRTRLDEGSQLRYAPAGIAAGAAPPSPPPDESALGEICLAQERVLAQLARRRARLERADRALRRLESLPLLSRLLGARPR